VAVQQKERVEGRKRNERNITEKTDIGNRKYQKVRQGGPKFFFPRTKNSFSVGPNGQETPPGTIFGNY
jgi:hypothetical protein